MPAEIFSKLSAAKEILQPSWGLGSRTKSGLRDDIRELRVRLGEARLGSFVCDRQSLHAQEDEGSEADRRHAELYAKLHREI